MTLAPLSREAAQNALATGIAGLIAVAKAQPDSTAKVNIIEHLRRAQGEVEKLV